ncbi:MULTISPECIES: hypothetical protein [Flavobacteriaceae]|uniref:hypothetical protein n=1 Tax=Flavobacteriaceae TaxID=49546 RepID=UPI0014921005|nr:MULTISPECIES: hypothetical protein [Allomuricauda]MDC6366413.1 hypothetical protein [Muricauda sp. AC10]
MKKNYSRIILCLFGLLFLLGTACSKDENDSPITFAYASDVFEVEFRSTVTLQAPIMEWPGDKGSFYLKEDLEGLSINQNTGAIEIERHLPAGTHEIVVNAISGEKSWETSFELNNVLKNSFWSGGQNNDTTSQEIEYNRQFWLFEDGTLEVEIIGQADSKGVGTWSIEGNIFSMHFCTYCQDANPLDIPSSDEHGYYEGVLTNESLIASISGQWYVIRFDPDSTQLRGNFYLEWD